MGIWTRSGTVSVANGSTSVTGLLTAWLSTVRAGDTLYVGGNPGVEVGSVDSNTGITLAAPWPFTSVTNGAYAISQGIAWGDVTRLAVEISNILANQTDVLTTTGAPDNSIGADNSLAFDPTAKTFWLKSDGAWTGPVSMVGPQGIPGDVAGPAGATAGTSVLFADATGKLLKSSGFAPREVLTANRTYYVSTTGSESNDGLTPSTPFLTIQKAINAASALDFSTFNVTIQLADGTYTAGGVFSGPWSGAGTLTVQGNTSDASKVIVSVTSNNCFACTGLIPSAINLSWMTLQTATSGLCIFHSGSGLINFGNLIFGACAQFHIDAAGPTAKVTATGNYSISGNAQIHILSTQGAVVSTGGRTITYLANVTFSSRNFGASFGGGIIANGMTFSLGAFTVTGKRYDMTLVSYIYTGAAGASYFPGSIAGTSDASSVYG